MIPHEREMVSKFKDKPFVLVSISADDEKKTLGDFLAKEKMPWTHWWSGPQSEMMENYDIEHFPTIYVLDSKGVIRHKEIRGDDLEVVKSVIAALDARFDGQAFTASGVVVTRMRKQNHREERSGDGVWEAAEEFVAMVER